MNSSSIRRSFVEYFVARGHRLHPSAPLVPHGDPTLLFTNAGMVPFKDYFLGAATPPAKRAVSVQKCLRVSGKHNDLENVGPSPRHHTFFEMLGNFSFGDYFKDEAIRFGWELSTEVWGLDPAHLFATVYEEDEDALTLWRRVAGLPESRILRRGKKDNFWAMGETGPCGPCSEIFVDRHPERPAVSWTEGTEGGRYLEIWNLVFMQFDRGPAGEMASLPSPSIDTGAGLERVTSVLQRTESNYDTDLFLPILRAAAALAGSEYGGNGGADISLRVIADHLRSVGFLLADGVIPGNEGRGYVLRRLLRRAVRHGMSLGFEEPFLNRLVPVLRETMGAVYPELAAAEQASVATVRAEEEKFLNTIAAASRQVQEAIEAARAEGISVLAGPVVFRFYDTFGLPLEVLREIAEEERFRLDEEGFQQALEGQRRRSREAAGEGEGRHAAMREIQRQAGELPSTEFLGYGALEAAGKVLLLARAAKDVRRVGALAAGESGVAVLDRSPFYGEAGGQVGDRGVLLWDGGAARVLDTQKDTVGTIYHFLDIERGRLVAGAALTARVDAALRLPAQRNHTATHLLHAALRWALGPGVRQAGSLVAPDRLRFDFTCGRPLTEEELARTEDVVNRWILLGQGVAITPDRSYDEAVADGAMALFGEKYGERVRTVEVAGFAAGDRGSGGGAGGTAIHSLELCGGCHVRNTAEIGPFVIVSEKGIASGVRRIEALTGEGALAWIRERRKLLQGVAASLDAPAERAAQEIATLKDRVRSAERELARLRLKLVAAPGDGGQEVEVDGVKVLAREVPAAPPDEIRGMVDSLRARLGSGVVVLGAREGEKVSLVAAVSADLTGRLHAGRLAQRIAALVGGSGGGRSDFAQAGGKQPENLEAALRAVPGVVREALEAGQGSPSS